MYLTTLLIPFISLILPHLISATDNVLQVSRQQPFKYHPTTPDIDSPSNSNSDPLKVPGSSPAFHCANPSKDLFIFTRLDFWPSYPRVGEYFYIRLLGHFMSATGDFPWLNITGSKEGGRPGSHPMFYGPLCDVDVLQEVSLPYPDREEPVVRTHRSCPPGINEGYTEIKSPAMPVYPGMGLAGLWEVRAEATTQDGRRIFCAEGSFNVTEDPRGSPLGN